jgi:hypothetical protein
VRESRRDCPARASRRGEIAGTFLRLPRRRLVILGAAGAGKSVLAVKLARDLLAARRAADPVPIILNAATWRPDDSVTSWIEAELTRRFPSMSAEVGTVAGPATLWLARTIYEEPGTDPADLLAHAPDEGAAESHLLARFLPAAYRVGAGHGGHHSAAH